ncbi:enoyl-hydratase isomerase family protein [Lasallia pustulata]|uniref:Enoyl-hydratase isomerase family protein n=1 Tax=Lasallia pustulata TaxID=136370 RepID=A0A1W5CZF9_9LECA|nr:enoyl-hydratase isomerase family protein [Lasallia pustulata]
MAQPASTFYTYFKVTYPLEYVAHVEINRPDRLNAFIEPMWPELRSIFGYLSTAADVRAIVFSGAGPKAFSTGFDVLAASETGFLANQNDKNVDAARIATKVRRYVLEVQDCFSALERCEKPVICALHGYALGLAMDLIVCADVRVCEKETKFAAKQVDMGIAADVGTLTRLPKIVGSQSWVKEVCLTGRTFGADEAMRAGLVSFVGDGKENTIGKALKIAATIAGKGPVAVQGTKELLNWSQDHTVQDGLRYTSIWNSAMIQTNDVSWAKTAGMKKTTPRFEKL